MGLTHIEKHLTSKLDEAVQDPSKMGGTKDWTAAIKKAVGELGQAMGYKVCESGRLFDGSEWLFDLVWYSDNGLDNFDYRLTEVQLVMECEWGMHINNISEDFQKLMVVNVPLRLMVCLVYSESAEKLLTFFKEQVEEYQQGRQDDRFLIAMMDWETGQFDHKVLVKSKGYVN